MLTYEELQYFAAFAEYGTLTEVAERFRISQPTITRAMKKAEEVFGVPLFVRTKNRISLNENGRLAAEEIRMLLKQTDAMIDRVRAYDKASRTISIGTSAAVDLPGLIGRVSRAFPEMAITTEPGMPKDLERGLLQGLYQLIVLPYDPTDAQESGTEGLYARPIGEEHLMFYLPKGHRLAGRKKLRLADLNGENLLLFTDIGFWAEIVREKMPDSRFLLQSERYTFEELIENSVLPCFVTDLTLQTLPDEEGAPGSAPGAETRVAIPITDPEVNVTYYLTCRRSMRKKLEPVFR